eukprot:snap_masked-scaffold_29-processed-gene-2.62-mRNA-1 protein AED:0.23 eAED:0.25 QI:0/-1/0/1/-1/1/1/0/1193
MVKIEVRGKRTSAARSKAGKRARLSPEAALLKKGRKGTNLNVSPKRTLRRKRKSSDKDVIDVSSPIVVPSLTSVDNQVSVFSDAEGSEGPEQDKEKTGKILSLNLKDFMCHKNLSISFGRKVNFVTGQNGSGKSAVLAGLQVCLGLTARQTKRGSSLKNLIRHGAKGSAKIRVEISNSIVDADTRKEKVVEWLSYKPEVFGPRIIIERTITQSGTTSFKLSSAKNVVVFEGKKASEEVKKLKDFFSIYIENPVCLLDQEASKNFLKGNSKTKYAFFKKATYLQKMEEEIEKVEQHIIEYQIQFKKAAMQLPELKTAREEARAKVTELQIVETLADEIREIGMKKTWLNVFAHEDDLSKKQKKQVLIKEKIEQRKLKLAAVHEKFKLVSSRYQELKNNSQDFETKVDEVESQLQEVRKELAEIKRTQKKVAADVSDTKKSIEILNRKKNETEHKLGALLKSSERSNREQIAFNLTNQIEKEKNLQEKAKEKLSEIENQAYEAEQVLNELTAKKIEKEHSVNAMNTDLRKLSEEQQRLKTLLTDDTARFGPGLSKLLALIQKNGNKFKHLPLHIGLNVVLKSLKWWKAVESNIRPGILNSFIVDNQRDAAELVKICKNSGLPRPRLRIGKFRTKRYPVKNLGLCVADVLSFRNVNVFNRLCDFCKIEKWLLFDEINTAKSIIQQGKAPGAAGALTVDARRIKLNNGVSQQLRPLVQYGRPRFFVSKHDPEEVKSDIEHHSHEEENIRHLLALTNDEVKNLRIEEAAQKRNLIEIQKSKQKYEKQDNSLGYSIKKLTQERMKQSEVSVTKEDSEIEKLQANLVELDKDLKHARNKSLEFEHRFMALRKETQPTKQTLQSQIKNLEKEYQAIETEKKDFSATIAQAQEDRRRSEAKVSTTEDRVRKYQTAADSIAHEIEQKSEIVSSARLAALEQCDDVELKRKDFAEDETFSKLDKLQKAKESRLAKERQKATLANRGEALDLVHKAKEEKEAAEALYLARKKTISGFKQQLHCFQTSAPLRKENYKRFADNCKAATNLWFEYYLSQRNYYGKILFDDSKKQIDFDWAKNAGTAQSQTLLNENTPPNSQTLISPAKRQKKDTRQLSGGEKSFTTLAFLLALSKKVECPFRVMDEFDVYMDAATRNTSIEILLDMAKDSGSQYIFVTPNNISMVKDSPDVRKLKLHPVLKGGQSTLD